jgi:hypothetical protein
MAEACTGCDKGGYLRGNRAVYDDSRHPRWFPRRNFGPWESCLVAELHLIRVEKS